MATDIIAVDYEELEAIRNLLTRIDTRVVPIANPCPSRREFDRIRSFVEALAT